MHIHTRAHAYKYIRRSAKKQPETFVCVVQISSLKPLTSCFRETTAETVVILRTGYKAAVTGETQVYKWLFLL